MTTDFYFLFFWPAFLWSEIFAVDMNSTFGTTFAVSFVRV